MSGKEYSALYGSLWSEESIALKLGKTAHNKGKKLTDPVALENMRIAITLREERFQRGEIKRGSICSDEKKKVLSQKNHEYAINNQDELKERSKKAYATKRAKGPIVSSMKGKHHSQESKNKIVSSSKEKWEERKLNTFEKYKAFLLLHNINLYGHDNFKVYFCNCLICNTSFSRTAQATKPDKFRIDFCPICRPIDNIYKSKAELEVFKFILNLEPVTVSGDRMQISPLELDVFLPNKKIAIEYCGLYWHSDTMGKGQEYHRYKCDQCNKKGIDLITIFEDEWSNKQELVKAMLKNKLGLITDKIFARKCIIKEISTVDARLFLEENHIHGYAKSNIKYGLFCQNKLVYVMTFSNSNISRGNKDTWEIQRMAGVLDIKVIGGASRLFAHFIKNINPIKVISYADLRWFTGNSYKHLGFTFVENTVPGYWYFQLPDMTRIHRYSLRKNKDDDQSLTEWENRQLQGYDRIWDCGHAKWLWTNENKNGA